MKLNIFFQKGYLGSVEAGKEYDATELVKKYSGPSVPVLIDQVIAILKQLNVSCDNN